MAKNGRLLIAVLSLGAMMAFQKFLEKQEFLQSLNHQQWQLAKRMMIEAQKPKMKRQVLGRSGKQTYSQRWLNTQASSDSESDDERISGVEAAEAAPVSDVVAVGVESLAGAAPIICGSNEESMYRAALEGDWLAAEIILDRDPNLATGYITQKGDRALHVAAAMEHKEFLEKLAERVSEKDLELVDGRGYTACCYAAVSGKVEIARVLLDKSPDLATLHGEDNTTPLHRAASLGKGRMVLHFLESTKIEDLSTEEWFDLLLLAIHRKLFVVAAKILEINEYVATMTSEEGTALHLLARQERFEVFSRWTIFSDTLVFDSDAYWREDKSPNFNRLAQKLWDLMQKMETASLLELIKKPAHILHHAAKAGHPELITMLTRAFPTLIWDTDSNGYTVFHIAVAYRQYGVFSLASQVRNMINLRAMSQDRDGNNILHLAAKLAPRARVRNPQSVILMQREMSWFKWTTGLVPCCWEMRNKDGLTPRELFSKEHKSLFEYSEMSMKNTADSFMLIATIFLTVVFALAFAVPGGYDGQTGMPILVKRKSLQDFILCQVFALVCSVVSIVLFRSIIASTCSEDDFQYKLPMRLYMGFSALYTSLVGAIYGFLRSVMLVNPKTNVIMWILCVVIFLVVLFWIVVELGAMLMHRSGPLATKKCSGGPTLFTGDDGRRKKA